MTYEVYDDAVTLRLVKEACCMLGREPLSKTISQPLVKGDITSPGVSGMSIFLLLLLLLLMFI